MRIEKVDVLVIGAGPAGSVAAAILHQNGHQVKVVEKQQFPRFVIGESLLPRCLDNLQKAGLLEAVQAQQFPYKRGASFVRAANESCTFDFSEQFTNGWEYAYQMPRANFDKTLADEIVRQGVALSYQESVEKVVFDDEKAFINIQNNVGEQYQIEAKFVVDASGYGRVLPRLLDLGRPSNFPARTAFFAHIKDKPHTENTELLTEIIDLGTAWAWIIPIQEGVTSIGFVGDAEFLEQYGDHYDENLFTKLLDTHPTLKDNYAQNVEFVFSPKVIKGYSVGVKQMYGDRYVLVGNSTEFLDPIFSSGVTFATETGAVAGELLHRQLNGMPVDWEKDYVNYIQHGIEVFRTYIKEWYTGNLQTIFFATEKDPSFKKQICSVLAGYVWDKTNPYVKKHRRAIPLLADVIRRQKQAAAASQ
ncbi:NAD(P)/FAD-dependent oxidoreductase [Aureispira sp. CCB-QB1]|uniref:NAD(P)/FAD-dependent oxidoreductase n=1 Tax=Aureispira sp. CCB-QB1 TaxID=1313421 RepID=UPI0006971BCB|nr:NAD(P)/FAD-dependent oxidoreductase [Aureispira sp. CCB-QB1]